MFLCCHLLRHFVLLLLFLCCYALSSPSYICFIYHERINHRGLKLCIQTLNKSRILCYIFVRGGGGIIIVGKKITTFRKPISFSPLSTSTHLSNIFQSVHECTNKRSSQSGLYQPPGDNGIKRSL